MGKLVSDIASRDGETGVGPAQQGRMRPIRWEPGRRMVKQQGGDSTTLPGERIGEDLEREGVPAGGDPHGKHLCHAGLATAHAATVHQSRQGTQDGGYTTIQGAGKAAA